MKRFTLSHSCRRVHRVLSSCCIALALQTVAYSQEATSTQSNPSILDLDAYVVTGTNFEKVDAARVIPVSTISADEIDLRQAFTPMEMLTALPQVTSMPDNETRLGSSGARGDHTSISLRSLRSDSTLILINGRRLVANPMTTALQHNVNINHLPTQGIERIEILRDGASSIYGSDAIGGVVNYVLNRDFSGTEVKLRFGFPEHGGGAQSQASIAYGTQFEGGKVRWFSNLDVLYRDAIFLTERDFSASADQSHRAPAPFDTPTGPFNRSSANSLWPRFRVLPAEGNMYFRPIDGTPTLTGQAPNRTNDSDYYLDINAYGMAHPRTTRANLFNLLEVDLTDSVTLFAELAYYRSESRMRRQPMWLNAPVTDYLAIMAMDNPYNPYGSHFYHPEALTNADGSARLQGTPSELGLLSLTVRDLGAEDVRTEADVYRILAGLKGQLGQTWTWESAIFRNQVKGKDRAHNDVRESLLQQALLRTDASAFNPFGYTFRVENGAVVADQAYTNPESVVESFAAVYGRDAEASITSVDFKTSGRLLRGWAGDIQLAAGGEYREEELEDIRPPFGGLNPVESGLDPENNDFLLHPPRPDVFGDRSVWSVYSELAIPVVDPERRWTLLRSMDVSLSARHEHYSDFGGTTKLKYGVNWSPSESVMVRASVNEGFKAPSLSALYTTTRWTISGAPGTVDSYRNPVLNEGPYINRTQFGGNPELKASESEGFTYGIVIDVPGIEGLRISADYWKVEQTDIVGQRSEAEIRASDTALLNAFIAQELARGVSIDQIDLGSGTERYQGDPDIIRFAPTEEDRLGFANYNAQNPSDPKAVVGRIFQVDRPFVNLSGSEVSGWDFALRYASSEQSFGRLVLSSEWSHLEKSVATRFFADRGEVVTNHLEMDGAAKWRGTTSINWYQGPWSAGLGIYYIGSTLTGTTTSEANYESLGRPSYLRPHFSEGRTTYRFVLGSVTTFNLNFSYRFSEDASKWLRDSTLRLGVVNLTDKEPPLAANNFGYDPGVHGHLITGRMLTLELTRRF